MISLVYDPILLGLKVHSISGGEYIVKCPYHNDSNPSGSFNPQNGLFFCFSCGASATVYQLAQKLGSKIKKIPSKGLKTNKKATEWKQILSSPIAINNSYLLSRQVTNEQIERFKIREFNGGIAIPINGLKTAEIGVLIRKEQGKQRYFYFGEKPAVFPLQGLSKLQPSEKLFLVEGIFGFLRADLAGINAVTSMSAMLQRSCKDYLRNFNLYGLFDNDFAGYLGAGKLLSMLPNSQIVIPGKEADELSIEDWQEIAKSVLTTRSLTKLAELSKDKKKYFQQLSKI